MTDSNALAAWMWHKRNMSDLHNLSEIAKNDYYVAKAQYGLSSPTPEVMWHIWGERAKWESAYLRMVYPY